MEVVHCTAYAEESWTVERNYSVAEIDLAVDIAVAVAAERTDCTAAAAVDCAEGDSLLDSLTLLQFRSKRLVISVAVSCNSMRSPRRTNLVIEQSFRARAARIEGERQADFGFTISELVSFSVFNSAF